VAPRGSVLCTDLDPRHIPATGLDTLRIERHDIVRDPLPEAAFDLVHARLVLVHIPERLAVLERLITALKPGGWLVIEDFDTVSMLPDRVANPGEAELPTMGAMRAYMIRGGIDPRFGRKLYGRFRELGLVDVFAEGRVLMFDGANGGADIMRVNFEQIGEKLVAGGFIAAEQLRADLTALDRPGFSTPSPIMWTARGRRPPTAV
jgi:SAM-dependent methyltransferase